MRIGSATPVHASGSGTPNFTASYLGDTAFWSQCLGPVCSHGRHTHYHTHTRLKRNLGSSGPAGCPHGNPLSLQLCGPEHQQREHRFYANGIALGTAALSGVAILNTTSIPVGTDALTASYTSDGNFAESVSSAIPITVSVATGVAPVVALSPTTLTFSSQTVGTTSPAQPITLKNSGAGTLTISSIVATGDFAQTSNCGSSLTARLSRTIAVTFTKCIWALTVLDDASRRRVGPAGQDGGSFRLSAESLAGR
jgi:hypothetical protein